MTKKIFHGSEYVIEQPQYGFGKKYNDYGLGFYCTEEEDLAREWSVGYQRDGYANAYEIDCTDLKILDLNNEEYCILHWLAILLENREFDEHSALGYEAKQYILEHFKVDYEKYDIIVGYRADDSYFSFAQDFINGSISYRQLNNALHLGDLGQQFVLKSKKAFERIGFKGANVALAEKWYAKKELRDKSARRDYFDLERNRRQKGDIYITQIMDEEMSADDLRIR